MNKSKNLKRYKERNKELYVSTFVSHNTGITLVALVVTIIVLLILAGITITSLLGDNGIIKKAQEAVNTMNKSIQAEQKEMNTLAEELNSAINGKGENEDENIRVTGITLSESTIELILNTTTNTKQLYATITPDNATNKGIIWSSSSEDVAKVDQNGLVTAIDGGICTITAKSAENENIFATCLVTVEKNYLPPPIL